MEKLVNLTPHDLVLVSDGVETTYASCGIARVTEKFVPTGTFAGVVDGITTYGPIEGLPEPAEGTIFVVSAPLLDAALKQGRTDVRKPRDFVRDDKGRVLYAKAITRV